MTNHDPIEPEFSVKIDKLTKARDPTEPSPALPSWLPRVRVKGVDQ